MPKSRTLPSKSKSHVLTAYRSRGRGNRNLWLVYSHKTRRDWILGSDRHLVHWVVFLETNPEVRTFTIEPEVRRFDGADGVQEQRADATAELCSGLREYHVLMLSSTAEGKRPTVASEGGHSSSNCRIFTEADLFPLGAEAMRWLKLINYCAAIRDEEQEEATLACIAAMRKIDCGTLGNVLEALPDFDPQAVIGVFSRMVIQNDIAIDLSSSSFNFSLQWSWRRI